MIIKDILDKSEPELQQMLVTIGHEPIDCTPVILSELTRRAVLRLLESSENLQRSSERLERLTKWLIALTVLLAVLAVPPLIELIAKCLTIRAAAR